MEQPPPLRRQTHLKQNKDIFHFFDRYEERRQRQPSNTVSTPTRETRYVARTPPTSPAIAPSGTTLRVFKPSRQALSFSDRATGLATIYQNPLSAITGDNILQSNIPSQLAYRMFEPTRPTISVMEPRAHMNAMLVNVSEVYHKSGLNLEAATIELNKVNEMHATQWSIDPAVSTHESVVVVNPQNDAIVAMRGTDIKNAIKTGLGKGMKETTIWGGVIAGTENSFEYFKATQKTIVAAMERYNILNLTGFSLGGTAAIKYGNQYSIETLTTNPFLGKNIITHNGNNLNVNHTITRTSSDFATTLLILKSSAKNFLINTIDPLVKVGGIASRVRDTHSNRHFTENAARVNPQDLIATQIKRLGDNYGDVEMRSSAITAIEDKLSYTEWMIRSGNTGDIIGNNGVQELAPARVGRGSNYYEVWETESLRLNATPFNQGEKAILVNSPEPTTIYRSPLTTEELATVRATATADERLGLTNRYAQRITEVTAPELPTIAFQNSMAQTFAKNLVNIPRYAALGIGSIAGGAAVNLALGDVLKDMNPILASSITGAAGNVGTDILLSRLVTQSFAPKIMTLATGAVVGGIAAPLQVLASMGASAILNSVGLTGDANDIISQTVGGGIGAAGAITLAPLVASGIEAAGAAVFGIAAAEEAIVASTATANPFIIAGTIAVSALISGAFAVAGAVGAKNDFMLLPDRQRQADTAIGSDPQIVAIMTQFNDENRLWKPEDQAIAASAIQARAREMENEGIILAGYNYTPRFQAVPRGYMATATSATDYNRPTSILAATYPDNFINTGVRTAAEQQQYTYDNRETAEQRNLFIINLDPQSAEAFRTLSSRYDTAELTTQEISEVIQVAEDSGLNETNIANIDLDQLIATQRAGPTDPELEHIIVSDIKSDPEFATLASAGDKAGANKRIVEYLRERADGAHLYRDIIEYDDPYVPQIGLDNQLTYGTITDAINNMPK